MIHIDDLQLHIVETQSLFINNLLNHERQRILILRAKRKEIKIFEFALNLFEENNFNMESTLIPQNLEPKKEEWALINNQQALEYQKMKEFEKYNNREKRERFRN